MRHNLYQRLMFPVGLALAAMLLLFVGLAQAVGPDDLDKAGIAATLHTASPAISAEQAVALAVNDLVATGDGYEAHHPQHNATFSPAGLTFTPRRGGPAWIWQLTGANSDCVDLGAIAPRNSAPGTVAYPRGGLVEQYLLQADGVEQQFVIPAPLALDGADLVIEGAVNSDGVFETASGGWRWRTDKGAVSLGDVYVFDAAGRELPATMDVTADETRIVVDGAALAQAAYPVTVDPQIGSNDFRISDMGDDSETDPNVRDDYGASSPGVAYNSTDNEYLVVWSGDDDTDFGSGALKDGEFEIWGQRINAATGAEMGVDFRISDMGGDADVDYSAKNPQVAYNSGANEYLVVWSGDDTGLNDENEIYAQRINAATGAEVSNNDFRISDMGPDGDDAYDALYPSAAYNNFNEEYLVVWYGDDDTDFGSGSLANNETEVFGQRIHGDHSEGDQVTGETDFRISDMGPDGEADYDAYGPQAAAHSTNNEYLVVWYGDDNTSPLVNDENEIYGQRIPGNHTSGNDVGDNDFRISDMGDDSQATPTVRDDYNAGSPGVAYSSTDNE
ncbi:MAG: hypothetical protein GY832_24400, partial [Chloroflexi bacterium]|nr:hypothetical protein [Chloroflexota bacterium]